jgi:hypothetical protein
MDSYGIAAVFRSRRHDSFNRNLADDLARQDPNAGLFAMSGSGNIREESEEFPGNWIRGNLARKRACYLINEGPTSCPAVADA